MRILCLADLHLPPDGADALSHHHLDGVLRNVGPLDLVLLAGDLFESDGPREFIPDWRNPYAILADWFPDLPVLFVLGNHEFFRRSVAQTHAFFRRAYDPDRWNVHCLDLVGHYDCGSLRILGNVLWYDGSLAWRPDQRLLDFADGNWMDCTIRQFDPVAEHRRCLAAIRQHHSPDRPNLLLTHTAPHRRLALQPPTQFSAFSGCANLLDQLPFAFAVCGHTHLRNLGCEIDGCRCVNPGAFSESHDYALIET